jgi:hypothetical protein
MIHLLRRATPLTSHYHPHFHATGTIDYLAKDGQDFFPSFFLCSLESNTLPSTKKNPHSSMSTSWTEYVKHHGGGTIAASADWKRMSDVEKAKFRPQHKRARSRGSSPRAKSRGPSRRASSRSRSRSRSRPAGRGNGRSRKAAAADADESVEGEGEFDIIEGEGEISKGLLSAKWVDLHRTMIQNHWPREIATEMVRVYRKDIKAKGFAVNSKHWYKVVLPFAARDPTVAAEWKEIVDVVRKTNIKLPKLTTEMVHTIETLRRNDTKVDMTTPEFKSKVFTVYMVHFAYLMATNLEPNSSTVAKEVAVGAASLGGAAVLTVAELSLDIVIGVAEIGFELVAGALWVAGNLALVIIKSPFLLLAVFFITENYE